MPLKMGPSLPVGATLLELVSWTRRRVQVAKRYGRRRDGVGVGVAGEGSADAGSARGHHAYEVRPEAASAALPPGYGSPRGNTASRRWRAELEATPLISRCASSKFERHTR